MGDRWAVAQLLNNQAAVAADQGDFESAREMLSESLVVRRQLGDRAGLALSLNTLAEVYIDEARFDDAIPALDESLAINRELDDRVAIAYVLEDYGGVAAAQGRPVAALRFAGFASQLRALAQHQLPPNEADRVEAMLAPARLALTTAAAGEADASGRALAVAGLLDDLFNAD